MKKIPLKKRKDLIVMGSILIILAAAAIYSYYYNKNDYLVCKMRLFYGTSSGFTSQNFYMKIDRPNGVFIYEHPTNLYESWGWYAKYNSFKFRGPLIVISEKDTKLGSQFPFEDLIFDRRTLEIYEMRKKRNSGECEKFGGFSRLKI